MYRAQFFKFVTVASLLVVSQGNHVQAEQVGFIAQAVAENTCQIDSLTGSELITVANPSTGLTGNISIVISCKGNATGTLLLTLNPSVVYNGGAKMQFVSKSGVLAGAGDSPSTNVITVPITSTGNQTGNAVVRVDIVAPSGKLLRAASNYNLVVNVAFNQT